ncbi:YkvI family membrane protein [Jeotgalibacillus proteolyticus]|uniref:YkvI family membrane protein n=1 Tax=Jeotgalibacillus proteolyticus TaxID=2082395 RepID=UPI001FD6B4A8|nr:hypothetical protein [Jeotgalibacillus proteolyticus]
MKPWNKAFQVAAVYVGTIVGTGFATGKEIVEFFTQFGFMGFFTILISGYFFISLGTSLMIKAIDLQAHSYEELNRYLFGNRLSKGVNFLMMAMLLGFCIVMLSGAGAVFEEQLKQPKIAGVLLTVFLLFGVLLMGSKGLLAVNSFMVPLMILFNLLLLIHTVSGEEITNRFFFMPEKLSYWKPILYAFIYPAMNLAMAQAVLVPLASEIKDKVVIRLGGMLGGLILTLLLLSSHLTLITLPEVAGYAIPMAVVMKGMLLPLFWIYVIVIYGEIFTSILGNMYGLEKQLKTYTRIKSPFIFTGIILFVLCFSFLDYSMLLRVLYPLFGYISFVFFVLLWVKANKQPVER